MKYLAINLSKLLKELCMKIFKTLMKDMFKRHKRKHVSYLLTGTKTDTQINRAEQQSKKGTSTHILSVSL